MVAPIRVVNFDTGMPTVYGTAPTPFDFGAKADGTTDDSTAIQSAINSLSNGGLIYFPAGTYAIGAATAITLPTAHSVCLLGAGRGSVNGTGGTILKATASIGAIIKSSSVTFSRGHRITNMTIDGNNNANFGLQMDLVGSSTFDVLDIINCLSANFRLGTATLNSLENVLFAIRLDNPLNSHTGSLPPFNFDCHSTNNYFYGILGINASTANFHAATTSSNNVWSGVHGYNFDYTSQVATASSTNNFLFEGTADQITSWEADGSSAVNVQVNGNNNIFSTGVSIFQSPLMAQIGMQFANSTSGNVSIGGFFANSTFPNCIVQTGTPFGEGNISFGNWSAVEGGFIGTPTIAQALTTVTGTSYTQLWSDTYLSINPSNTFTITLQNSAISPGRILYIKTIANFAVNSAFGVVVPLNGGAAGTAILPNTAGKWAILASDGTNWNIIAAN